MGPWVVSALKSGTMLPKRRDPSVEPSGCQKKKSVRRQIVGSRKSSCNSCHSTHIEGHVHLGSGLHGVHGGFLGREQLACVGRSQGRSNGVGEAASQEFGTLGGGDEGATERSGSNRGEESHGGVEVVVVLYLEVDFYGSVVAVVACKDPKGWVKEAEAGERKVARVSEEKDTF